MGFFDFLGSPKQDSATLQAEQAALRKKHLNQAFAEPSGVADEEGLRLAQHQSEEAQAKNAPRTFGQGRLEVQRHEQATKGLEVDFDKAVRDAHAVIGALPGFGGDTTFRRLSDDTRIQVAAVRKALDAKAHAAPAALADDFERLAQNKEFDAQQRGAMAGVAAMFRRAQASLDRAAVSRETFKPTQLPEEALKAEQSRLDLLKRQEEEARKRLLTLGYTNPQRVATQNAILEIAKEREEAERNLKEFAPQGTPAKAPASSMEDINRGFGSAGVTPRQAAQAVNEGLDALSQSMGGDFDLAQGVSFKHALPYAIQAMGPEAQVAFSQWLKEVRAKENPQTQGYTGNPAQDAGAMASPEGSEPADGVSELRSMINENFRQQRLARAELAEAQELQSWPAIIAFVVLGMLIGPQGAFAFFSNARRKNQLKGWLDQLELERRDLKELERWNREQDVAMKREAARRLQKKEDTAEEWRQRIGMELLKHRLIIERNAKRNNPETALMKKLSDEFQRSAAMASKFSKTKDDPLVPQAQREDAYRNFEYYIRKAAALDQQLSEMGGDVLDEEDEE